MFYDCAVAGIELPTSISGAKVHMVGIKGTGMAALAEILVASGVGVRGTDTTEKFYTDDILISLGVPFVESFRADNLLQDTDLVIYSAAYDPQSHEELVEARRRGLRLLSYPKALGMLSENVPSVGIAGVHGKTTTAALCAAIVKAAELPGTVLAGSALADLGGRATLSAGGAFFIAETCEYRRNFLHFRPSVLVVTNIEADHLDYFADRDDVQSAFAEYAQRLPDRGELIYCADDPGACELATRMQTERSDLIVTPYGARAQGEGHVEYFPSPAGELRFAVGHRPFTLRIPGRHNALNAAASLLAVERILPESTRTSHFTTQARAAIASFSSTSRRSEVVGEAGGVLVMDDYAHHPTAIAATLEGLREFYPERRIVLDFMSHTYSRTRALLDGFGESLARADTVIVHRIYASAREENPGDITGEHLADAVRRHKEPAASVRYIEDVMDALPVVQQLVRPGDLFITMGAGNNWQLGRALLEKLKRAEVTS